MALKWYTRARKFPQLIGRTPDGTRIPGGPYTYTQVAAGVVTAIVLAQTAWLWAHGGLMLNATIFIGTVVGAVIASGKLSPGMRNPLVLASGALNLLSSGYRLDGGAVRSPKTTSSTSSGPVTLFEQIQPQPHQITVVDQLVDEEEVPLRERLDPSPSLQPALTNVQRLLLGEAS